MIYIICFFFGLKLPWIAKFYPKQCMVFKHTFVSVVKLVLIDIGCNCIFVQNKDLNQFRRCISRSASAADDADVSCPAPVSHQMRIFIRRTHACACTFLHLTGILFQSRNDLHLIVCQRVVSLIRKEEKIQPFYTWHVAGRCVDPL